MDESKLALQEPIPDADQLLQTQQPTYSSPPKYHTLEDGPRGGFSYGGPETAVASSAGGGQTAIGCGGGKASQSSSRGKASNGKGNGKGNGQHNSTSDASTRPAATKQSVGMGGSHAQRWPEASDRTPAGFNMSPGDHQTGLLGTAADQMGAVADMGGWAQMHTFGNASMNHFAMMANCANGMPAASGMEMGQQNFAPYFYNYLPSFPQQPTQLIPASMGYGGGGDGLTPTTNGANGGEQQWSGMQQHGGGVWGATMLPFQAVLPEKKTKSQKRREQFEWERMRTPSSMGTPSLPQSPRSSSIDLPGIGGAIASTAAGSVCSVQSSSSVTEAALAMMHHNAVAMAKAVGHSGSSGNVSESDTMCRRLSDA